MNKNIYEIFKCQVFCTKLNLNLGLLKKYCFQLQKNNQGIAKSNVGGWQSEDLFDEHPITIQLKNKIVEHINSFSKEFNFNKKLQLSNLWVNINGYRDSNDAHTHPASFFSGVFYVKAPKKSGKLTFINPNRNFMEWVFDKNITGYIQNNSSIWSFEPEENMLYIFPSFLEHKVTPHMNKTEKRISISFNSVL